MAICTCIGIGTNEQVGSQNGLADDLCDAAPRERGPVAHGSEDSTLVVSQRSIACRKGTSVQKSW